MYAIHHCKAELIGFAVWWINLSVCHVRRHVRGKACVGALLMTRSDASVAVSGHLPDVEF
jgi:hypothetical protein